jgi:hypothetical protein
MDSVASPVFLNSAPKGPGTPHPEASNEAIAIAEAESSAEELAQANPST